jgi:hypothetical protein
VAMMFLPVERFVHAQDHFPLTPPYLRGSIDIMIATGGINLYM